MAETTETKAVSQGATGRIVRIVGAVVDVEFPPDAMPAIYNALTVKATTPMGEVNTILEVQTHLPATWCAPLPCRPPTAWCAASRRWTPALPS